MIERVSLAALAVSLVVATPVVASDEGYIYGRVETVGGEAYRGQIRWGTEESFWDDIFNATKVENENLEYLDRKDLRRIRTASRSGWDFLSFGDDDLTHVFAIRFGDLKQIERRHGDLYAEFRNGDDLRLEGGSNDVGAEITVVDPDRGRHIIHWNRIRRVQFMETPSRLEGKLGEPIYGTVKSGRFEYVGRIQWDNDECLTIDKLDGDSPDGKVSVEFGEIASIRKHRHGAMVTLKSGEELYMTGTNDVNHENRGVVVNVRGVGSVKIGWDDFEEARFSPAPNSGRAYSEYGKCSDLVGTVATRTGRFDGRIVFDLDESWDFELLQGTSHDTEFLIPFRDIARIRPEGQHRSVVELRNGLFVEMDAGQDVTRDNDGLLVFQGDREPRYIDWLDITEVVFR